MSKKQASFDYPVKAKKEANDMQYLLLIYTNESHYEALGEGEQTKITGEYMDLVKSMRAKGQYVGGNHLDLTRRVSRIQRRIHSHVRRGVDSTGTLRRSDSCGTHRPPPAPSPDRSSSPTRAH